MNTEPRQNDDYYTASEDEDDSTNSTGNEDQTNEVSVRELRRSQRVRNMNEVNSRVARALKRLGTSGNVGMTGMTFIDDLAMVGGANESYDNPDTFDEVWEHPNKIEREYWRGSEKRVQ